MINIQVKYGNKIIADDTHVNVLDMTVAEFKAQFEEVQIFFTKLDVTLIVQTHYTHTQWKTNTNGSAYLYERTARVWTKGRKNKQQLLQICLHELGHLYHYMTSFNDFHARTDYGLELYAEEFCQMVMLDKYELQYCTYYPVYDGYKTRAMYKRSIYESNIKNQIKPLDKS